MRTSQESEIAKEVTNQNDVKKQSHLWQMSCNNPMCSSHAGF